MSTSPKTNRKKTKCKMESPISNDRAEAFVGPRPEICPKFFEVPPARDAKAFDLSAKGMTQRQIAKELKTSQSTVQRAIKKYRLWFGMTLPEDRGELVGWARFRVAVEEQRIFLRHQQELAMEEWHQTRKPVKVKRTRTKVDPQGRKMDGMPIKDIQIDEYMQRRHASAAHFNAAARRSLELTMLEAGYLGVRKLSCDQAIDVDDRDRWDRAVKSYQATIEELTRKMTELEAKLAAKNSTPQVGRGSPDPAHPGDRRSPSCEVGETFGRELRRGRETRAEQAPLDESRTAQTTPARNQTSLDSQVANPIQITSSGDRPDSPPPLAQKAESDESSTPALGEGLPTPPTGLTAGLPASSGGDLRSGVSAGPATRAEQDTLSLPILSPKIHDPEPEPYDESVEFCVTRTPKWNSRYRQEALDYWCQIHGIPPLELHQVIAGFPDPKTISPKMAIERGYPYIIHFDRSIPSKRPPVRDKRKVITVW